ncbi:hypothetical protein CXG81DRAFT_8823 [Caulochytrium protostelioides]|uniref:Aminopeptidase P N-terminal domain-containing protein n=1 Tax=Caulochytrium protostelioides TaxID=1555241 RepID=A0A4P9XEN0_9FUNG|nr:hypothetical protein CXG81DRAFT_8823 [Caulochytrium protostelioides]|eukprot:RKP04016.1 hypothetical protein CXG81DRAFT_8823 [Caulochytrium protostelioides]
MIYVPGGRTTTRPWTDTEAVFRQESHFFYLTGVEEPDHHLLLDVERRHATLLIPDYGADHALWSGPPPTCASVQERYAPDAVAVATADTIKRLLDGAQPAQLLVLPGTDLAALPDAWRERARQDESAAAPLLQTAFAEARIIKNAGEQALLRRAGAVSAAAHVALMQGVRGCATEREAQALFEYECFRHDAPIQAYTPIVAAGRAGAVLHYTKNTAPLPRNSDDLLLVDAGAEVSCYAADITRTYPLSGRFTGLYKTTYEIVLETQKAVLAALKPGVAWEAMHTLALQTTAAGLQRAGLVRADVAVDELMAHDIPALFLPHGLGHAIGLDVHDAGGYPKGTPRIDRPSYRYLRMRRDLQAGMAVTVEPGCYFVDAILDAALANPDQARYLVADRVAQFRREVGGVRIEDDVLITDTGYENLTAGVPKEMAEIEALMAQ